MLSKFTNETDVFLVTIDSCRWDTYKKANTPKLDSFCKFRKAYTQGTYTYPSHLSIYSGILPNVRESVKYYNRFEKNLFRISGRKASVDSYIEFPPGTDNIVSGFEERGYNTYGCAAVRWFKHPALNRPFNEFKILGIDLKEQIKFIRKKVTSIAHPQFAFMNIGETHDPYEHGGHISPSLKSRARMRSSQNNGFLSEDFKKQISSLEYVDEGLGDLLDLFESRDRKCLVIITSDHGECFGEDGMYGHGFYHPKVMEVPIGIFEV